MSYEIIRSLLETHLDSLMPRVRTAWESVSFTPEVGELYQRAFLLPANTQNPTLGDDHHREIGIFQVSVCAPLQEGAEQALERAELIRWWFKRGTTLESNGFAVRMLSTPSIAPAIHELTAYVIPVSINFTCDVFE